MDSASELYRGKGGELYWKRHIAVTLSDKLERAHSVRRLCWGTSPPWLELGCGQGWNMTSYDIGLDIDPRNKPHMVWDVRQGLPFTDQSFPVVFCVGLLMHLSWEFSHDGITVTDPKGGGAQFVLSAMARVAQHAVIIGEYIADVEKDLLWDYHNGSFGNGQPGLVYERPYPTPEGFTLTKQTKLEAFGDRPTFLVFERENRG